jgi:L-aminopeptidase/D-esterase-like protein
VIDALFEATAEATEEAILNALFRATTVVGRDGNRSEALPLDQVRELLIAAGRIPG